MYIVCYLKSLESTWRIPGRVVVGVKQMICHPPTSFPSCPPPVDHLVLSVSAVTQLWYAPELTELRLEAYALGTNVMLGAYSSIPGVMHGRIAVPLPACYTR